MNLIRPILGRAVLKVDIIMLNANCTASAVSGYVRHAEFHMTAYYSSCFKHDKIVLHLKVLLITLDTNAVFQ